MASLIITADDFGFSEEINEAVERGHREGVLSAASLMVTGEALDDALRRARRLPDLRVGLHLVLVQGKPVLPPTEIPSLVNRLGRFHDDLLSAGMRWFFHPSARQHLAKEISAQFAAFFDTGLKLDHVNGHNHMQVHPTVFGELARQLRTHRGVGLRVPREPWLAAVGDSSSNHQISGATRWLVMAPWLALMRRKLLRNGITHNEWLLGIADSGHLNEKALLSLLDSLPGGVSEIHCHPAVRHTAELSKSMPDYENEAEFAALISKNVRSRVVALKLSPGGYSDLLTTKTASDRSST
ncbi:hopanoid biosynthesis associated protein HpnK [Rhodoligotrophos appendicifer]|uniref:hopanoid biosynthesis-associated protein HpnK n=1 Tax=Rhodoligotrophos appendicifer TaxID=987056 RepID=UPI00118543CA|nr:hopanoid biosynthesis-associated protein HpnK [Rhodoligotrophos appendicifer]